jgi:hypothetical protein
MCNRYSIEYGYLCDECFQELVSKGIDTDIDEFMSSEKPEQPVVYEDAYAKFNDIFELRN